MLAKSHIAINNLRSGIARIGKMSDNVVGVGPIGIGIGGVLAWIPVVGPLYSFGAGGLLLLAGLRARVPLSVMIPSFVLLSLRTTGEAVSDLFPVLNIPADVAIDLFRAHKWTADMMIKAIDETHYVEGRRHPSNPAYVETRARIRSGAEKRRVVFLG